MTDEIKEASQAVEEATVTESEAKEELTPEQIKQKKKNEIVRVIKFVLFSASAGVIQLTSCLLLEHVIKLPYVYSYLISVVLSVLWNFTFNRKFTFKSASNVPKAMLLVFAYYLVFTPVSSQWSWELENRARWNTILILLPTMLINMATEYLWCTFVVFRKSMNTNDLGKKEQEALQSLAKAEDTTAEVASTETEDVE